MRLPGYRSRILIVGALLLVVFTVVSFYFYGPLRHSQLGLIDDHEIIKFLGKRHAVSFLDVPRILATQTEVGQWGEALRLRPVYYVLRIIETALWGDRAGLWYLTRMTLVAVTAAGAGFVVLRALYSRQSSTLRLLVAAACGALIGSLALTIPALADIATRLGPSEIYVGAGLVLFAIGTGEVVRAPERTRGWILACLGLVIVVGSKEDGVLLLVPFALLYLCAVQKAARRRLVVVLGAVAVVFSLSVALGVAVATARAGADMYGNRPSLANFVGILPGDPYLLSALACFIIAVIWDISRRGARRPAATRGPFGSLRAAAVRFPYSLVAGAALYLALGEAFFYQNYIEDGAFAPLRYSYLSDMAVISGFATVLAIATRVRLRASALRAALVVLVVAAGALTPLSANVTWAENARPRSIGWSTYQQVVSSDIREGVADLRAHPHSSVLILVGQPSDYERVFALPQYLSFYGAGAPVFLDVAIPAAVANNSRAEADLTHRLEDLARTGKSDSAWRISPASTEDGSSHVVCFSFGVPRVNPACDSNYQIG